METRKLRHAIALARFLNFTRAAHHLNITQSALSRSIQALEAETRLKLFDRDRGTVAVTQAGREFVRHAEALLRSEAALWSVAGHAAQGEGGHVTLGVTALVARILLAPVLAGRVDQPHFHAEVTISTSRQLLQMVMQESTDLAICVGEPPFDKSPFAGVRLARLSLAIIARRDHPLARLDAFGIEEFQRYPLVTATPHTVDDASPVNIGLIRGEPPNVVVENFDVLNQIVVASDAVWVTSSLAAREGILRGELVQLPITWIPEREISLTAYWLKRRTLSPVAEGILRRFEAAGADLPAT